MPERVDCVILGGGVAGVTLAWQLFERNRSFVLVDPPGGGGASAVAAGLVTPLTGKRIAATFAFEEAYPICDRFYRRVEVYLQRRLWYVSGSARVCGDAHELEWLRGRLAEFPAIDTVWLSRDWFDPHWRGFAGGFYMPQAARLDVPSYLSASREFFAARGAFRGGEVDLGEDVELRGDGLHIARLALQSGHVVSCRGAADRLEPLFAAAQFRPAQGDILRLRFAEPLEAMTLHAGWWLTPLEAGRDSPLATPRPTSRDWLLGSTYQWRPLDNLPSPLGRESLLERLGRHLSLRPEVLEHRVGIRPSSLDHRPLVGVHPEHPRLSLLNGLGAKGCYLAPWCAARLADHLFEGRALPAAIQWPR